MGSMMEPVSGLAAEAGRNPANVGPLGGPRTQPDIFVQLSHQGCLPLSSYRRPDGFNQSTVRVREQGDESSVPGEFGTISPSGPVRAVLAILDRWHLSDAEGAVLLGAESPDFIVQLRRGRKVCGRDANDRVRLLLKIYEGVFSLFRDPAVERQWLLEKRDALERKSVLDLMTEGSMMNLITALDFVDYVNGR